MKGKTGLICFVFALGLMLAQGMSASYTAHRQTTGETSGEPGEENLPIAPYPEDEENTQGETTTTGGMGGDSIKTSGSKGWYQDMLARMKNQPGNTLSRNVDEGQDPGTESGGTGSTGGSTGGCSTTGPYNSTYVVAVPNPGAFSEIKAINSYANVSGTTTLASKHVLRTFITIQSNSGWAVNNSNMPETNFWTTDTCFHTDQGIDASRYPAPPATFQYWSGTDGQQYATSQAFEEKMRGMVVGTSDIRPHSTVYTMYIVGPAEAGSNITSGNVPTSATTTAAGLYTNFTPAQTVATHRAATGSLSGGSFTIVLKTQKKYHKLAGVYAEQTGSVNGQPVYDYHYYFRFYNDIRYEKVNYDTLKLLADDAAVDSRKGFATGNFEGETKFLDPNAEPNTFTFWPHVWKGGLFAGNMPGANNDKSGLSRTQFYPSGGTVTSATKRITLVAFYTGAPTPAKGEVNITAYVAAATDPNLNVSQTNLVWQNKWDRTGSHVGGNILFPNAASTDIYFEQYSNWWLPVQNPRSATNVGIGVQDESTGLDTLTAWRYFASKEYQDEMVALSKPFPWTDCRPRVWLLNETGRTIW